MPKNESPADGIDWRLTTWDGSRREQLRRWAALPLERVILAIEEMQELAEHFRRMHAKGKPVSPASGAAPQRKPGDSESPSLRDTHGQLVVDRVQAARRALELYMRHMSEENWAASWLIGLEFILWDWVLRLRRGAEPASQFERANKPDIEAISWLAEEAGGWWYWDDSVGVRFVPLSEWLEIFEKKPRPDVE